MIKVINEVKIYEINNKEVDTLKNTLIVESHWNRDDYVVLKFDDKEITVSARDLKYALDNATNTNH